MRAMTCGSPAENGACALTVDLDVVLQKFQKPSGLRSSHPDWLPSQSAIQTTDLHSPIPTVSSLISMVAFFPLYIRRSDGTLEAAGKGPRESNQPTDAQLDSKPDSHGVSDFYRECPAGDAKEVDWRRKLGGMLMRELGGAETKGSYYICRMGRSYN